MSSNSEKSTAVQKSCALEDNTPTSPIISQVADKMQKVYRCLLLAVAFVALADGHSLTGLKAHRSRRAVVPLTTEQKNILVDKHNELRRLAGSPDMEKMVSITQFIVIMIHMMLISPNDNIFTPGTTSISLHASRQFLTPFIFTYFFLNF